jgi:hypothetical protein
MNAKPIHRILLALALLRAAFCSLTAFLSCERYELKIDYVAMVHGHITT